MTFTQSSVDAFHARQAALRAARYGAIQPVAEPRKSPPSKQTEAEIQAAIAAYLRSFGNSCHFDVQRMDQPTTGTVGRPDFIGALRGVGFALEVKRPGCKETREQAGELLRWQLAGFKVAVVHSLAEAVEFFTTEISNGKEYQ